MELVCYIRWRNRISGIICCLGTDHSTKSKEFFLNLIRVPCTSSRGFSLFILEGKIFEIMLVCLKYLLQYITGYSCCLLKIHLGVCHTFSRKPYRKEVLHVKNVTYDEFSSKHRLEREHSHFITIMERPVTI
jgi:hypothetical protein